MKAPVTAGSRVIQLATDSDTTKAISVISCLGSSLCNIMLLDQLSPHSRGQWNMKSPASYFATSSQVRKCLPPTSLSSPVLTNIGKTFIQFGHMPNSGNNQSWSEEKSPSIGTAWFHNHYENGRNYLRTWKNQENYMAGNGGGTSSKRGDA